MGRYPKLPRDELLRRKRDRAHQWRLSRTEAQRAEMALQKKERWLASSRKPRQIEALERRGAISPETRAMVAVLTHDHCAYCGWVGGQFDHIDPTGDSDWTNLTAACQSCNSRKHNMPLLHALLVTRLRSDRSVLDSQIAILDRRRRGLANVHAPR